MEPGNEVSCNIRIISLNYSYLLFINPQLLTGIFIEKDEPLPIVLQGLCDLLSFYVLLPKTNDLYLLLTQNIVDSSNWVSDKRHIICIIIAVKFMIMLLLISVNWCKILLHASLQLNYLVTDDINVSGSGVLPETCAPNDTSLLYQYCLRKKLEVSGEDVLNELLNVKITNGLIDYHLDRPIVSTSDQCQWLQTNFISTVETRIKMRASRVDACNMRQLVL